MVMKGEVLARRISQDLGMNIHTLPYIRSITNKHLLHNPGNSI